MASLTSTLTLKMIDDVSKPARTVGQALKDAERAVQEMAKGMANTGATDRFVSSLSKIKVGAKDINTVAQAWKDYSKTAGLAANSADWTKGQAANVRQWESQTISALRKVKAEQIAFNRSISGAGGGGVSPMMAQMSANAIANAKLSRGMGTPAVAAAVAAKAGGGINMGALGTVAGVYGGYKAGQFASNGINAYREYSDTNAIIKPVGELTPAEVEKFKAQQRQLGVESRYSPVKIAEAQKKLIERQVPKEFVEAYTRHAVDYASALNIDLPEAVTTLEANIFSTGKLKGITDPAQAEKIIQLVTAKSTRMGKMGMSNEDISAFFEYGGLSATQAGISEDTAMAFATLMKKSQIPGNKAGVAVRMIAAKLVSPTAKGLDAYTAMGINWDQFAKMPDAGLSGKSVAKVIGGRFGKRLSEDQIARLDELGGKTFTDEKGEEVPIVGDKTEYVMHAMEIFADSFEKNKKGEMKAKDADALGKAISTFYKMSIASVDSEGLLRAIMAKHPTLAQLNALFGTQQGSRAGAALMNPEEFAANRKKLEETPLTLAADLAAERLASFDGAVKQLEGSVETLQIRILEAFDNYGKGNGALTEFTRALTSGTNALINVPDPIARLGTEATIAAAAMVTLRGAGVISGGMGLTGLAGTINATVGAFGPLLAILSALSVWYEATSWLHAYRRDHGQLAPSEQEQGENKHDVFGRMHGLKGGSGVGPGEMSADEVHRADHPSIRRGSRGNSPFIPGREGAGGSGGGDGKGRYSVAQAAALIRHAGGTEAEARALGALVGQESEGNPRNANLNGEHSIGLWQINQNAHHGAFGTDEELMNPETNAKAALALYRRRGNLGDWANTINTDRYKRDLAEAGRGAGHAGGGIVSSAEAAPVSPDFDHGPIDAYHRKVKAVKADLEEMHEMTVRPSVNSRLGGLLGKTQRGHFSTAGVQGD